MEVPAVDDGDGDGEEEPSLSPCLAVSGRRRGIAARRRSSSRRRRRRVQELLINPPDGRSHRVRGQLRWLFQLDQDFPDTFKNSAKSLPSRRISNVESSSLSRSGNVSACVKDEEEEQEGGGLSGCLDQLGFCSALFGSSSELWSFDEEDKSKGSSPTTSSSFSVMADETEKWGSDDWQFQAELLMAECNLLRVEKELAERRWQQSCVTMDQAVRLAQTLRAKLFSAQMQGRRREETENIDSLLNKSDNLLLQQLSQDKLERSLRRTGNDGDNYSFNTDPTDIDESFDEQRRTSLSLHHIFASSEGIKPWGGDGGAIQTLQEKLQNLLLFPRFSTTGDQSTSTGCDPDATNNNNSNTNRVLQKSSAANGACTTEVAAMQDQLDCVSRELEETQDIAAFIRKEYRSMLSNNGSTRHPCSRLNRVQGVAGLCEEVECREAVKKMIEAEAEQWSQVQCILRHVNKEMEDLRKERDIWEQKALRTQTQLTALQEGVYEWRVRAGTAEEEAALLRSEVDALKGEVEKVKLRHAREQTRWLTDAALNNNCAYNGSSGRSSSSISNGSMKNKKGGKLFSPLLLSDSTSGEECRRRRRRSRSRSIQKMNLLEEEEEEEQAHSSSSCSSKENMLTKKMQNLDMGMHSSRRKKKKKNKKRNSLFPHSILNLPLASSSASPSSSLRSPLGEVLLNHHHNGLVRTPQSAFH